MHETCDNLLSHVNSCIYYDHQTYEILPSLPYAVNFQAPS